jgi:Na+-transporting methylmalonyl-CoA/oxaloacetate decarboxylase gamma subunit
MNIIESMGSVGTTLFVYGLTIVISLVVALLIKIIASLLSKFSKPVPLEEDGIISEEESGSSKDAEIAIVIALAKSKK